MAGTTYYNLNLPDHGDTNWDTPVNANFTSIDNILHGKQDSLTAGGNIDITSNTVSLKKDGTSITNNSSGQVQATGIISTADGSTVLKARPITRAVYNAMKASGTLDANTFYGVIDDTDINLTILEALYPVGSVYETTNATCPIASLILGSTWVEETSRVLVEKKAPTNNDPTWYNLYSDGWCEQGGIATANNTTVINAYKNTVTFLKAFKDTYYTALGIGYSDDDSTYYADGVFEDNTTYLRTANAITFTHEASTTKFNWKACGYTSTTTSHKRFRRTA